MLTFKSWLKESSQGDSRSLRKRLFSAKRNFSGSVSNSLSYTSNKDATRGMREAMRRAQDMNRENGGVVRVYHMITPHRSNVKFPQLMAFLNSKGPQEISVSVEKGVWNADAVLEGYAKLFAYFPTDVNTFYVQNTQCKKLPRAPKRTEDSHHWDEAVVKLSDVFWETLYVGDDPDTIYMFGGWNEINKICRQYEISVEHSSHSGWGNPVHDQYEIQEEIKELTDRAMYTVSQIQDLQWKIYKQGSEEQKELINKIDLYEFKDYLLDFFQESPEEQVKELEQEVIRSNDIYEKLKDISEME